MNPTQLEFQTGRAGQTQCEKLRAIFRARPHEWIPMPELADAISAYAVHSRVADLRREGMPIRQKCEGQRPRKSFYCYEPDPA